MKKRYFFALMVFPALFAACTNDDIVTVQETPMENSVLKDRARGELVLTASKSSIDSDTQSRIVGAISGTGINWLWEGKDDKVGAVVVDYKNGVIATDKENYTLTNYAFSPNIDAPSASAEFTTPSTVVQGAYMFYNRFDGNNVTRGKIQTTIDRIQKVDAGEEAGLEQVGTVSNGGQNFFVSPIMDMAIADGELIETPIKLTSAHSVLQFTLKADLEDKYWGNFTVNKVVIKGKDGNNNKFARTLTISPKAIADIQVDIKNYVDANGDKPYDGWFKDNGAIVTKDAKGNKVSDEQISAALKLVTDAIALKDKTTEELKSIGTLSDKCNDLQFQLENPFVFNSKDDVMKLMVVVPAGKYAKEDFKTVLNKDPNTEGLFELDVYTSEGIYKTYLNSYDEDGNAVSSRTLERGKKYGMPEQTLIINGGKTNVSLFDQAEAFNVETTEDWNYAIDYINAHYRDYGNTNAWQTPTLNIPDGSKITVDADHYFPAFPVKYVGDADLFLVGQNEYKFDPTCAILDDTKRPTLNVVDQKNASVVFDKDVKDGIKNFDGEVGTDGKDITAEIELVSDAKVLVKQGTEVQFTKLENRGVMTIEPDVKVEVDDSKSDKTQAFLLGNAKNSGEIIVQGRLTGSSIALENTVDGIITVKGFENGMNDKVRGIATLANLTNNGIINIESGANKKGTYGGKLAVTTKLTNNYAANGSAIGDINNNGELIVAEIESNGTITVGEDPYALIKLETGTVTDKDGVGSVVLADATQYEMYDTYYNNSSNINAAGVVETTLNSQEAYDEIVKNDAAYNSIQTALEVLNKVTVDGVVLKLANADYSDINVYLADNAGLDIKDAGVVTFNSINAEGANTAITNTGKNEVRINAASINTAKAADLTIADKVNVMVDATAKPAITLYGTLTNKGYIDAEKGTELTTRIPVEIKAGGKLNNEGRMSKDSEKEFSVDVVGSEDKAIADLIANFYNADDKNFNGTTDNYRIEINNGSYSWSGGQTATVNVNASTFKTILSRGTWMNVVSSGYYGIAWNNGSTYYAVYFNTGTDATQPEEVKNLVAAAKESATSPRRTLFAQVTDYLTKGTAYDVEGTLFNISNWGTLDLSYSSNVENASKSWAYGDSENMVNTAVKVGKFTNEMNN